MRHAYLIIAHNEFDVLRLLVSKLDDFCNDIFVHIDKKVEEVPSLNTVRSKLYVLDRRIDVRWGHVSQIETELLLFETAIKNDVYDYYHLISGTHLPIQTLSSINSFFEANKGMEIMRLWEYDAKDVSNKLQTYHFFMRWYNSKLVFVRNCVQVFWRFSLNFQHYIGVKRNAMTSFVKADNWVSLTHGAVKYLVDNKRVILRKYKNTFCGDEYFVPTELSACGQRFKIRNCINLLYVRFDGANAVQLGLDDLNVLTRSNYLFARKFSSDSEVLKIFDSRYA